jgi:uncharacterized protein
MRQPRFHTILLNLLMLTGLSTQVRAENGDQFLDGIGETALIARYPFDGSLEDRSRNGLDASVEAGRPAFVEDKTFGKVLALPGGKDGAPVKFPGKTLNEAVSFSVTGWVKINDESPGQCFFDFGTDEKHHISLIPMGAERENGCQFRVVHASDDNKEQGPSSFRVVAGEWVHLAAVLDTAAKTLSLYVDGTRVGQTTGIKASMDKFLSRDNPAINKLYLGKSLQAGQVTLGGKLHDVRFYSIALSDKQVAVIRHNAISDEKITSESSGDARVEGYREDRPRLLYDGLERVPDVQMETVVGELPHLPYELPGTYSGGGKGPAIRVIWPSPVDNSQVSKAGTYVVTGRVPGTKLDPKAAVRVLATSLSRKAPNPSLEPFQLGRVVLNPDENGKATLFIKHRDKFIKGLAETDPDTFLYVFRDAFGQKQPNGVKPLGVWDSQTTRLRGHATGHYLTAIAQAYASTGYIPKLHAEFAKKMDYMIDVLHELSMKSGKPASAGGPSNSDPTKVPLGPGKKEFDSDLSKEGIRTDYWNWGKGFISGYSPDQFIMLEHGASYGGGNNQIWSPYYTLHKILAGLVDCYEVGGNPKALEVAKNMGLWVYDRLKAQPAETRARMWKSYIAGEYGGMNEIMARLNRITGDKRFLEGAKLFDNTGFFFGDAEHHHGLAKNVDTLRGEHANQHIPQIIGALETYKETKDTTYFDVAENFWDICTHSYMYSIGGVAGARNPNNAECFTAQPDTLFHNGLSDGGQNETCATYNMLKLGRDLFMFDLDAKHMDYYERALYNHILASVDNDNPGNTYHVPLNPGAKKTFSNAHMDGFTCCNGTALESATKLQDSIYFRNADNSALYVNLYVPSTLDWTERHVKVGQSTNFPFADTTTLTLQGGGKFSIHVRMPEWATQGFFVQINGKDENVKVAPGSYLALQRNWKDGDTIKITMPMSFHFYPLMDQPNIGSIFYGPVLLAAEEPEPRSTWRSVKLDANDLANSITGDPATLHFKTGETAFKPFFEFYQGFHSVYLDIKLQPSLSK